MAKKKKAPPKGTRPDYDSAERHAIKEIDPDKQLLWIMDGLDPDLKFKGWRETQVTPPKGMPMLRCDCVAQFAASSGLPWFALVEAQAQRISRMATWVLVYMCMIYEGLCRTMGQDVGYQMMGAILNLSDSPLSNTIDWVFPVDPSRETEKPGVRVRFFIRNVRQEKADDTLAKIERGELPLCILVWLSVMAGGDNPELIARWREQATRQEDPVVRADYAAVVLTLSEMVDRRPIWEKGLEGFNMRESPFLLSIQEEGRKMGLDEGLKKGLTKAAQQSLRGVLEAKFKEEGKTLASELASVEDPDRIDRLIRTAAVATSADDFRKSLPSV